MHKITLTESKRELLQQIADEALDFADFNASYLEQLEHLLSSDEMTIVGKNENIYCKLISRKNIKLPTKMPKIIKLTTEDKKIIKQLREETAECIKLNENLAEKIENILLQDNLTVIEIDDEIKQELENLNE